MFPEKKAELVIYTEANIIKVIAKELIR